MPYKVYLDTCIVSGLAKEDLPPLEFLALQKLLQLHKRNKIALVTSAITQKEIEKIPEKVRQRHEMIYNFLNDVPLSRAKYADSGLTQMGVGGGVWEDPMYTELKKILPDENDRQHVFQAIKSECVYFVTTDRKTILKHASKVFLKFGEFMVLSPSGIVELLSVEP